MRLLISLAFFCSLALVSSGLDHRSATTRDDEGSTPNKIKLDIYYETVNSVVRKFMVEELQPALAHFSAHLDLQLFPYGRTVTLGSGDDVKYNCTYDLRCEANLVQACALAETTADFSKPIENDNSAKFVTCFFKNRKYEDDVFVLGEKCSAIMGDVWFDVLSCAKGDPGKNLNKILEEKTQVVKDELATDGLVVQIGGTTDPEAKSNLLKSLCSKVEDSDNHPVCSHGTHPKQVKVAVYYESLDQITGNYFLQQLSPYYHVLEDIIDLDLVPFGNTQLANNENMTATCPLGESQCISNRYQALVVDQYLKEPEGDLVSGHNRVVNFVSCLFREKSGNQLDVLQKCTTDALEHDDYVHIIEQIRVNSAELKEVLKTMQSKTKEVLDQEKLTTFPIVTVNDIVSYNAFDDLVQTACQNFDSAIKPQICTKVNVTILYETLQHKSRKFFLEQVKPLFNNLVNLVDFKLIPAGRAQLVPGEHFVCPNSRDQCEALKLHACVIDYFWNDGNNFTDTNRQSVMNFIQCDFKNKPLLDNVMMLGEVCADQELNGVDTWITIHSCFSEGVADALLGENIEVTDSMVNSAVNQSFPIVFVNDVKLEDISQLRFNICNFYDEYHSPDYCDLDDPVKVDVAVYYEAHSEMSKSFFTTQLDFWYKYLEEMINIKYYPVGNTQNQGFENGTCTSVEQNSTCFANRIQAYVIDKYANHDDDGDNIDGTYRTMMFLSCVFSHANWQDNIYLAAEYCTENKLGKNEDWFSLLVTINTPEGAKPFADALEQTKQFKESLQIETFDLVPWITLDEKHNKKAAEDLLQTICSKYQGEKPLECTPVVVEIYYSAFNALSRHFFIDELTPTFRHIRERIQLDLIPYGPIQNPSLTVEEQCNMDPDWCKANKLHACAIEKFLHNDSLVENSNVFWDEKNQTLSYIQCFFKNLDNKEGIDKVSEDCATNYIPLADEIKECAAQNEGLEALKTQREKTIRLFSPVMEHSPWIVINGHRSSEAQGDLQQVICDQMLGDKPDICYQGKPNKVKVQFHYSALDYKVENYVQNELYPTYRGLEEIIDLQLVPYGLTEILENDSGNATLICPNGADECLANRIHACVVAQFWNDSSDPNSDNNIGYDGKLQTINFLNCYFTSPNYPSKLVEAAESCVEESFATDDWTNVRECARSELAIRLLKDNYDNYVAKLLPHLTYVPWITVNGKHSYSVEHHFQRTMCDTYKGERPEQCLEKESEDETPVVEIYYEPMNADSRTFFTTQLDFAKTHLTDLSTIRLVPFGRSTKANEQFQCIGDAECHVYVEQACVIQLHLELEPSKTLEFLTCTFEDSYDNPETTYNCYMKVFELVEDGWDQVKGCTTKANEILDDLYKQTTALKPKLSHVPWVLINGEHSLPAELNLVNEICSGYYPDDKPTYCQTPLTQVGVYYQNKDNTVKEFFINQLPLFIEYLDELGNFSFVPYGLTKQNGDNFVCPAGTDQCTANKIHACVLNKFYNKLALTEVDRIRSAEFIECSGVNENPDPVASSKQCFENIFTDQKYADIEACSLGSQGQELYTELAKMTGELQPTLQSVPWITINSKNSKDAIEHLFEVICDSYSLVKAPLCAKLPKNSVKVGVFFSTDAASVKMIKEQIYPFFEQIVPIKRTLSDEVESEVQLQSLIDVELTAWGDTVYDESNTTNPFRCSTGDECFANRILACADHHHRLEPKSRQHLLEFALCFLLNDNFTVNAAQVANECSNLVWQPDPYPILEVCAKEITNDTVKIFLEMKAKTENNYPELTSFPTITINNMENKEAVNNLMKIACINYKGYQYPKECDIYNTPTQPTTPTAQTTPSSVPSTTPSTVSPTTPSSAQSITISLAVLVVSFFLIFL